MIPGLESYILMARDAGFRNIKLLTNGLQLADTDYAQSLVNAGADSFLISLHSPDVETLDFLVRRRNAFVRTVAGIRNLAYSGVPVFISFVMNKLNYEQAPEFVKFCAREFRDVNFSIVFSYVIPVHNGWTHGRSIVCRYEDSVPSLLDALDAARRLEVQAMVPVFCGIPMCLVPRAYWTHLDAWAKRNDRVAVQEIYEGYTYLEDMTPEDYEKCYARERVPRCGNCPVSEMCPGIFKRYLAIHGTDEFE